MSLLLQSTDNLVITNSANQLPPVPQHGPSTSASSKPLDNGSDTRDFGQELICSHCPGAPRELFSPLYQHSHILSCTLVVYVQFFSSLLVNKFLENRIHVMLIFLFPIILTWHIISAQYLLVDSNQVQSRMNLGPKLQLKSHSIGASSANEAAGHPCWIC